MTNLFSEFPNIEYNNTIIKDITVRIDFLQKIKNNVTLYSKHIVKDNEKIEDIAYNVYGNAELYWIIASINNIVDPYLDWILTEERLIEYVTSKYGVDTLNDVHHHEDSEGNWVASTEPGSKSISNIRYEEIINEDKREIKLLKREYVSQVLSEYKLELQSTNRV